MVLFLNKRGGVQLRYIDTPVWWFQMYLLEGGQHVIAAVPRIWGDHGLLYQHKDCKKYLERFRPDLKISEEKGSGDIWVVYTPWVKDPPQLNLTISLSRGHKEPDWAVVKQTLKNVFPTAGIHFYVPSKGCCS
jgi:hypothetical protein